MYKYASARAAYPGHYKDPDVEEAEHLTEAAYHLIEAGLGDAAQPFIEIVCRLFDDVPLSTDAKSEIPAKILGRVSYLPYGILRLNQASSTFYHRMDVPAPAYKAEAAGTIASRTVKNIKSAKLGWFAEKQIIAEISGKPMKTSAFRPAAMLGKIIEICGKYDPEMPRPAAVILAKTLRKTLSKNPSRQKNPTATHMDMSLNSTYCANGELYGLSYLTEAQVKTAVEILRQDKYEVISELRKIEPQTITWAECSSHDVRAILDIMPRENGIDHMMVDTVWDIIGISNLQRCHNALTGVNDKYLTPILSKLKITDSKMDVPSDLWKQAALCLMAENWDKSQDEKQTTQAINAMRDFLEHQTVKKLLEPNGKTTQNQ